MLLNWVLVRNRLPPVVIGVLNKEEYYKAIEAADKGDEKPFAEFLAKQLLEQYTKKDGEVGPNETFKPEFIKSTLTRLKNETPRRAKSVKQLLK